MTERMTWRRAVRRDPRLPAGVKLVLLTHSERGAGHHHDESTNEHAFSRRRLAAATGKHEATIRRAYRTAEAACYLVMHEKGDRGQQRAQGRGHQTVFHYTTPDDPWPCSECGPTAAEGVHVEQAKGVQIGAQIGCTHYPLSDDRDAPPVSTPGAPAPRPDTYLSIVAAISAAGRTSGDDTDDPTSSPRRQLTTSGTTLPLARSEPSPPAPPIGATATTDRARDDDGFRWPSSWRVI